MKDKLTSVGVTVIEKLKDPYYMGKPAELAFYFMMSLLPTILLLTQLLAEFSITKDVLSAILDPYVSKDGAQLIFQLFNEPLESSFNVMLAAAALWGASKVQYSLMCICNYAYHGKPWLKGYVSERLRAIKNSLFTIFSILFALLILVYGDSLLRAFLFLAGDSLGTAVTNFMDKAFGPFIFVLRWLLGFAFYNLAIMLLFYNAPSKKVCMMDILPGSLVTSIGMIVVTGGYSIYAARSAARTASLYGSFSSVIALLFWFFLLGNVLVIGILINAAIQPKAPEFFPLEECSEHELFID